METNGTSLAVRAQAGIELEKVLVGGDLSKLSSEQRVEYVRRTCESLGLNPLTRPFELMNLGGKTVMYAKKDATEQLRKLHSVSIEIVSRTSEDGVYTVTARATLPDGRKDEDVGSVVVANLKGEALANATMKAHTKAKRRVTLSICGLGILDESELDTVPGPRTESAPAPVVIDATPVSIDPEPWNRRFTAAKTVDEVKAIAAELRSSPGYNGDVGLDVSVAYEAAKKRVKGGVQ